MFLSFLAHSHDQDTDSLHGLGLMNYTDEVSAARNLCSLMYWQSGCLNAQGRDANLQNSEGTMQDSFIKELMLPPIPTEDGGPLWPRQGNHWRGTAAAIERRRRQL